MFKWKHPSNPFDQVQIEKLILWGIRLSGRISRDASTDCSG